MRIVQQGRMRKTRAASGFFALAVAGFFAHGACAASTAWHEEEGGSLRLVTAGLPDGAGRLRGVLDIVLKPGWKTYWRDPGTAGVPPSFDVSASRNVAAAALAFPAPERHDDGYGAWAGYSASVALPVTFTVPNPAEPAQIKADVFLGFCRDICVPVSAHFTLDASSGDAPEDAETVKAAFVALPAEADAQFGVSAEGLEGGTLTLLARMAAQTGEEPELFVAGENGLVLGVPKAEKTEAGWRFAVPLLDRPAGLKLPPVFYTLVAGKAAVSGTFSLP